MRFDLAAGEDFRPPVFRAIEGYPGEFLDKELDLPPPQTIVGVPWSRFLAATERFLASLAAIPAAQGRTPDQRMARSRLVVTALEHYEAIMYRFSEFVEAIDDKLRDCVLPKDRRKEWTPQNLRRLRRDADLICNKIKHNQCRLSHAETESFFGVVHGFVLCETRGSAVQPHRDLHAQVDAFSFPAHLRQTIVNAYLASGSVASELKRLGGEPRMVASPVGGEGNQIIQVLKAISKLKLLPFVGEEDRGLAVLEVSETSIELAETGGKGLPVFGNVYTRGSFVAATGDQSFPILMQEKPWHVLTKEKPKA